MPQISKKINLQKQEWQDILGKPSQNQIRSSDSRKLLYHNQEPIILKKIEIKLFNLFCKLDHFSGWGNIVYYYETV